MKRFAVLALMTAGLAACGEAASTAPAPHDTRPWAENALSREDPDKLYVFLETSGLHQTGTMCRLHWKGEDERFKTRQEECKAFTLASLTAFREAGYSVTEADVASIALWDWYVRKVEEIGECRNSKRTISEKMACDPKQRQ